MTKETIDNIIRDNTEEFNDAIQLGEFIDSYSNADNSNIKGLEDDISECADSLVPIYYNAITKKWTENGKCQGLTVDICGEYAEKDIYKMMQSDLYFWYESKLQEDYDKLIELIDETEAKE